MHTPNSEIWTRKNEDWFNQFKGKLLHWSRCSEQIFSVLITIVEQMDNLYHQVGMKKQMLDKNSKEYKQYQCSTNCHICEEEIINTMSQKEFLTWGRPEEDAEDDFVREGDLI